MKKYKLAVFDMAGTTVEEGGSVYRVLKDNIEKAGFELQILWISKKMSRLEIIGKHLQSTPINNSQDHHERNLVTHPCHPDFDKVSIIKREPFYFDLRL
jgi:hypothetical protein